MLQENGIVNVKSVEGHEQPGLINTTRLLLVSLLEWQMQPDFRNQALTCRIRDSRRVLNRMLKRSPVLRVMLGRIMDSVYLEAKAHVDHARALPANHFPAHCPYALDDLLSPFFFPQQ